MKDENRVLLRPPTARDEREFLAFVRENRRLHRPWVHPPATPPKFREYLKRCRREDFAGFVVRRREDDALVGVFNLSQIFRGGFQNAYLGYYGSARLGRAGYMSEGLSHLMKHAFHIMKLHRVEANVQPGNSASIALLRRAGFRKEGFSPRYLRVGGRWRDHERWAVTREDLDRRPRGRPRRTGR